MTVVVGYVPTDDGATALAAAVRQATLRNELLVVINTGASGDFSHEMFASGAELDALSEDLRARGVEHEIRQPTTGRAPAQEILGVAEDVSASVIVVGMRRRSPLGKMILGSTAQSVLLGATCEVLAVKPPSS